ncbi:MAG: AEC family transporter [Clostridia bacterium]|nr:AEC family transporter [Clostridia bacterium]
MTIFATTLDQMVFLFLLIAIGYILAKCNVIPEKTETILSKLENFVFIPALVLGTFMNNFTIAMLGSAGKLLLSSVALLLIALVVSAPVVRLLAKDKYTQNIYLYGLGFSNFGFMGNAIVGTLFPDIFVEYLLFTIVLWAGIYMYGAPVLLMSDGNEKGGFLARIKAIINPMFIAMAIGMVIGLLGVPMPNFADNLVSSLGNCMSPVAMLLTGMTVARYNLWEILKNKSIYAVSAVRLLVYPMLFLLVAWFVPMSRTFMICALSSLAMPLGLNTIVIPAAYGKDTKTASGMAIVSHILSCVTIPLMYALLFMIIPG